MCVYFPYIDVTRGLLLSPFVHEVFDVRHVRSWYPVEDDVRQWIRIGGKPFAKDNDTPLVISQLET